MKRIILIFSITALMSSCKNDKALVEPQIESVQKEAKTLKEKETSRNISHDSKGEAKEENPSEIGGNDWNDATE